jgi:hypothetical protein
MIKILLKRFLKLVKIPEDVNSCWEWQGNKSKQGYGRIRKPKTKNLLSAHRVSFMLFNGEDPGDLLVCHSCDNPGCVNPFHLWLGTCGDNTKDMLNKGRRPSQKGDNNPGAILTKEQVLEIREIGKTKTLKELSETYGVSASNISLILLRKTWINI